MAFPNKVVHKVPKGRTEILKYIMAYNGKQQLLLMALLALWRRQLVSGEDVCTGYLESDTSTGSSSHGYHGHIRNCIPCSHVRMIIHSVLILHL